MDNMSCNLLSWALLLSSKHFAKGKIGLGQLATLASSGELLKQSLDTIYAKCFSLSAAPNSIKLQSHIAHTCY